MKQGARRDSQDAQEPRALSLSALRRRFPWPFPAALFRSSPALYFALLRRYSFASLLRSFGQWRNSSHCTRAIFLVAPAVSFVLRWRSPSSCAGALFCASPSLLFPFFRCPLTQCASCVCTSLGLSWALPRQVSWEELGAGDSADGAGGRARLYAWNS